MYIDVKFILVEATNLEFRCNLHRCKLLLAQMIVINVVYVYRTSGSTILSSGTGEAIWNTPSHPANAAASVPESRTSALNSRRFSEALSSCIRNSFFGSPDDT